MFDLLTDNVKSQVKSSNQNGAILLDSKGLPYFSAGEHTDAKASVICREGENYPSQSEMQLFVDTKLPVIISTPSDMVVLGDHLLDAPLIGRKWQYGIHDCYEAIRSWYWQNRNVYLDYFPRDFGWWLTPNNPGMYRQLYQTQNFTSIPYDEIQPGDVILYRLGNSISHAAVYIDRGKLYSHLMDKLSCEIPERMLQYYMVQTLRYTDG